MKHEKRYRSTGKIGKRLTRFRIMPWLELLLALGFVAALGWAFWRFAIPFFENLGNHAYSCQKEPPSTPAPATPVPTPEPTHDPYPDHPLYSADLKSMQTEIVVPEYQYATDLTVVNGTVYAPVGNYTPDGTAAFVRLLQYDTKTKTQRLLPLPLNYKSIRFPAVSDKWIVYLDAAANGGGRIAAYNRLTNQTKTLKTVYTGLPKPVLYENTAFWIERTGQNRDKLFAVDLNTGEGATLVLFESSPYALSKPYAFGSTLLYVAPDGALTALDLETGKSETVPVDANYVHDPQMNADGVAFLDSNHARDGHILWYDGTKTVEVATGAVDFALGDGFIAYSRYEKNYVYFYGDGTTFCTTRSDETAMLLGAGDDVIVWMDVTWRSKDIMEYMTLGEKQ